MYISDYEAFVRSPLWHEITSTLKEVRDGLHKDLGSLDPNTQATPIARCQGRLALIDFILALPDDIKMEIEAEMRAKLKEESHE